MNHQPFIKGLLITAAIAFVISFGLSRMPQAAPFQNVIFGSLIFFFVFTIFQYFVGLKTADHPNKGLYIGVVQLLSGTKVLFTVAFVAIYVNMGQPVTNWFVLPFLLNYAIFTVFETATMMRVGKN